MQTLRNEILQEAVAGQVNPEWVALQMVRLYREHIRAGMSHEKALEAAKREMSNIKDEALRIRKKDVWREQVAPWFVIVMGGLACYGWWVWWE